jgi:hypothetical protein
MGQNLSDFVILSPSARTISRISEGHEIFEVEKNFMGWISSFRDLETYRTNGEVEIWTSVFTITNLSSISQTKYELMLFDVKQVLFDNSDFLYLNDIHTFNLCN